MLDSAYFTQAKAPYTVVDLQERVVANGIGSRINDEDAHPTLITIQNVLFNQMLELLPLVPLVHGCESSPMRVHRVTIVRLFAIVLIFNFCHI